MAEDHHPISVENVETTFQRNLRRANSSALCRKGDASGIATYSEPQYKPSFPSLFPGTLLGVSVPPLVGESAEFAMIQDMGDPTTRWRFYWSITAAEPVNVIIENESKKGIYWAAITLQRAMVLNSVDYLSVFQLVDVAPPPGSPPSTSPNDRTVHITYLDPFGRQWYVGMEGPGSPVQRLSLWESSEVPKDQFNLLVWRISPP